MTDASVFGFLNVDKGVGMTSHDVVARLRRGLGIKKVGHAGTLDPLATGVLIVCLGPATRLSEYAMHTRKRYRAEVHLGLTTDTYDAEGEVVSEADAGQITRDAVETALTAFSGEIEQLPPRYSAIKQGGRKLYQMARAGEAIEVEPRRVTIHALTLVSWQSPRLTLDVTCSAGTYIRSLAFDLGERLGVGAHLSGLRRTASGAFDVAEAVTLDDLLAQPDDWQRHLLPPDTVLQHLPAVQLDEQTTADVVNGRFIPRADSGDEVTEARAYAADGRLVAILGAQGADWRPRKVFIR